VNSLESALRDIAADLQETGARFALVGGLAVSVRTEPRFTRDADLAVAVASDAEAEARVRELQSSQRQLLYSEVADFADIEDVLGAAIDRVDRAELLQ
jgi:hypothetical protein